MENTVASILSDIGMKIQLDWIEACRQFGKNDRKTNSKKTIIGFINRKHCKKEILNNKKFSPIDNKKFIFNEGPKPYIYEDLNSMPIPSKSITFNRRLKRSSIIREYCTREELVHIKQEESIKSFTGKALGCLKFYIYLSCLSFFQTLSLLLMKRMILAPLFSQVIDW